MIPASILILLHVRGRAADFICTFSRLPEARFDDFDLRERSGKSCGVAFEENAIFRHDKKNACCVTAFLSGEDVYEHG